LRDFWAAALRVSALRESQRTPQETSLAQKPAGQPEAARDLVVESTKSPAARIKHSKEFYCAWQRRRQAIQFLIGEPWRYL